ncbi:hypothetical protein BDP55DRAFT_714367 [Colletotrichum godetiae]|uniref:Nephrocystin 3-like N-terminal domain-containing protein n=1 Tax=Colletotrichum godetiae TaxID=1209918 RepID=A0AAJ0ANN0_9PEZI|nr:uncharacterized protein BDP55DRAFT_714367 [Colletotrichum godetiae]KAK1687540.1 hypothetical protein BDP55DRAFT_714367 [Colletotrichum godetiae]
MSKVQDMRGKRQLDRDTGFLRPIEALLALVPKVAYADTHFGVPNEGNQEQPRPLDPNALLGSSKVTSHSMDPFTALGLAAAIIQFVEFGAKLVSSSLDNIDHAVDLPRQRIDEEVALRKLAEKMQEHSFGAAEPSEELVLHAWRPGCEFKTSLEGSLGNQQSSVLRELRTLKEATLSMQSNYSGKLEEISAAIQSITYKSSISNESPSDASVSSHHDSHQLHEKLACGERQQFTSAISQTWLELGKGICWISDKAGSGKSTLMKHLGNHSRTAELLSAWAEPQECIVASHYFWSVGTRLQKSINGLLRSLLDEIFRQMPDLIDQIVPEGPGQNVYRLQSGENGRDWPIFQLERIVYQMVDCDKLALRFFFFVDGLDEYDGDHPKLILIPSRLASSPNVKLCVSSRPWNVFEDAYGKTSLWKLALQDLTQNDI